jgi:hypothetical protein
MAGILDQVHMQAILSGYFVAGSRRSFDMRLRIFPIAGRR